MQKELGVITKTGNKLFTVQFDSIDELLKYCEHAEINRKVFGTHLASEKKEGDWSGTPDWETAVKYAKFGWQDGFLKIMEKLAKNKVNPNVKDRKFFERIEIEGYAPCVPRAIQGHPETMFNGHIIPIKGKIIDIFMQISASCGFEPAEIIRRGVFIANFINEIELKGYRTNLYTIESIKSGNERCIFTTQIKRSVEPLSIKRITFPSTNPAMLRRIYFRILETMPCDGSWASGYGSPDESLGREFVNKYYKRAFIFPQLNTIKVPSESKGQEYMDKVFEWNGFKIE